MNLSKSPVSLATATIALMLCAIGPVTVVNAQQTTAQHHTPHPALPPVGVKSPTFTMTATVPPKPAALSKGASIGLKLTATGGPLTDGVVDIEVADVAGKKIGQQVTEGQTFQPGQSRSYKFDWKPSKGGKYTVKVGIFTKKWGKLLQWNDGAALFDVQ